MQTLDDLRADIDELARLGVSDAYRAKQLHKIPVAPVVDRVQYILGHCAGKRVLHLGCGWPPGYLHQAIGKVASEAWGIDIAVPEDTRQYWRIDLDRAPASIPKQSWDIIVCAETLEHLGNPGALLDNLRYWHCPLIVTVPNAHSRVGRHHLSGGVENCHRQHVAYYSYVTLRELVTRYGYTIEDMAWYNVPKGAQPQEGEGLCMLVR